MTQSIDQEKNLSGHTIAIHVIDRGQVAGVNDALIRLINGEFSGLKVRGGISTEHLQHAVSQLQSEAFAPELRSPNHGLRGGELMTLGVAATPCFTALNGPNEESYLESVASAPRWEKTLFNDFDLTQALSELFSELSQGRRSRPAPFLDTKSEEDPKVSDQLDTWLPFNYRILPTGQQIYTHHDHHYRLPIYEHLSSDYDRSLVFSWFIIAQSPNDGGELVMYGLSGDDPQVPMLPSRFVDTAVLEASYHKTRVQCEPGDLFIFNSRAHIHRVSPVIGERPRVTIGGFMTFNLDRTESVFWS